MISKITAKSSKLLSTALSMAAAGNCLADPNSNGSKQDLSGTIQSTVSQDGYQYSRMQLKYKDITLTTITAPSLNSSNNQDIAGIKLDQEKFCFEINARNNGTISDFRAAAEIHLENKSEIGMIGLWGDREPYGLAYFSSYLRPEIRMEGTIDSEGDLRLRTLLEREDKHLSITLGMQDSSPLAAISFNNENIWLSGQVGETIPTTVKLAIGKIKPEISRSFDSYKAAGRNELADFPDIHSVPVKNTLGVSPTFNFGGRSPVTFLGEKPGDVALMVEWRENASLTAELPVRLPSTRVIKEGYIMPGFFNLVDKKVSGHSFEAGMKIHQFGFRLRAEMDSTGDKRLGLLGEYRF